MIDRWDLAPEEPTATGISWSSPQRYPRPPRGLSWIPCVSRLLKSVSSVNCSPNYRAVPITRHMQYPPVIGQGDGLVRLAVAVLTGGQFPQPLEPGVRGLLENPMLPRHLRGTSPVGLSRHLDPLFFCRSSSSWLPRLPVGTTLSSLKRSGNRQADQVNRHHAWSLSLYRRHAKAISVHSSPRGLAPRNDALLRCWILSRNRARLRLTQQRITNDR